MKLLIPLTLIVIAALACGRFQKAGTENANTGAASPSPEVTQIRKVVDLPAIFGKPIADVKKLVTDGKINYESKDTIDFEFPIGTLNVDPRASVNHMIIFHLQDHISKEYHEFYVKTPQEVANAVGIDLSTGTAASSDSSVVYTGITMNGMKTEISFLRKEPGKDKFDSVMVQSTK